MQVWTAVPPQARQTPIDRCLSRLPVVALRLIGVSRSIVARDEAREGEGKGGEGEGEENEGWGLCTVSRSKNVPV